MTPGYKDLELELEVIHYTADITNIFKHEDTNFKFVVTTVLLLIMIRRRG